MYTKILPALAIATLVAGCSSTPEVQTGDNAEVLEGTSLHKVDHSKAKLAYIDPDADLGKYNRVLVRPLGVDKVEIIQPSKTTSIAGRRDWVLTDEDKQALQTMFHEVMVKQLQEKGGYEVVVEPGDDVLEIAAMITAIAPSGPKDDNQSRPAGRSQVYTEGAGSIAVAVAYGDSETGEVLGLAKDSRSSNSYWGANNSVSNMADVRRMFTTWAIAIREGLDRVHEKK